MERNDKLRKMLQNLPPYCSIEQDRKDNDYVYKVAKIGDSWLTSSRSEGSDVVLFVDGERRRWLSEHQELKRLQKECGANHDAARWYAGLAKEAIKMARAFRLWLGHFEPNASADSPWLEFWYWPTDLAPEIHRTAGLISLWASEPSYT